MNRVSMTAPQMRRHECALDGQTVRLPPRLHDLLAALLLHHPDRWFTIHDLVATIWEVADDQPDTAVECVKVHVFRLRTRGFPIESRLGYDGGYRIPREARSARDAASADRCASCAQRLAA